MKILLHTIDYIGDVRMSDSQVLQATNNTAVFSGIIVSEGIPDTSDQWQT